MSRVKRRLNRAAVKAADDDFYKNHPEFIEKNTGKRIPLDPNDPSPAAVKLRRDWIQLYLKYGGELEDDSTPKASDSPVIPCPQKQDCTAHKIQIMVDTHYFAPMVEMVLIDYTITGPIGEVETVKLLVATEAEPDKLLLEKTLPPPYTPQDRVEWDGEVTVGDFKDCVNLESSPYQVQMTITTIHCPKGDSNKEKIEVLPKKIDIRVEDPDGKPSDIIKNLRAEMDAQGGSGRLIIQSPVFKTSSAEMNDDSSFVQYKGHVGANHWVPVLARIWLKGKGGSEKRSPKALYKTKVLWEVRLDDDGAYDGELSSRNVHAKAKSFQKKVSAYRKDTSEPKGRTAHKDVGGLRELVVNRSGSKKQWKTLVAPWNHSDPTQRQWAGFTECGEKAGTDAEAGVHFFAGQIGGDVHNLIAFIDIKRDTDVRDDGPLNGLPGERKSNNLKIRNWRQIDVVKNYKIGASTEELDIAALDKEYNKAAMIIQPKSGLAVENIQAQWRTHYQQVVADLAKTSKFIKDAALSNPDLYPVKYRPYLEYWDITHQDAGFFGRLWQRIVHFFGASDADIYRKECDKNAFRIYSRVAEKFPVEKNGLTFFKFGADGKHNIWKGSFTAGIAPALAGYGRNESAFLVFTEGKGTETLIHEVGHLLFLAHAPGHWEAGKNPAGFQADAHNQDEICLMSYDSKKKNLCGLCLFKLEGWNYLKVHKDGKVP